MKIADRGGDLVLGHLDRLAHRLAGADRKGEASPTRPGAARRPCSRSARACGARRRRARRSAWRRRRARPPMTRTDGAQRRAPRREMPASSPPPPTGTRIVSHLRALLEDLEADGALSRDRRRGGRTEGSATSPSLGARSPRRRLSCSGDRVAPAKTTSPPWRRTPSTLTGGVVSGMTITARRPNCACREGHRLAVVAARVGDDAAGAAPARRGGRWRCRRRGS